MFPQFLLIYLNHCIKFFLVKNREDNNRTFVNDVLLYNPFSDSGKLAERGLEPPPPGGAAGSRGETRGGRGRAHSLGNKSQSGSNLQSPG